MKTTNHTPGPWRYEPAFKGKPHRIIGQTGGVAHLQCNRDLEIIPQAEIEANARLIASAPCLLAALTECSETLRKLASPLGVRKAFSELNIAACAQKLIAKVKGEIE